MNAIDIACPRCEARQKFVTKQREVAEGSSLLELFVQCGKCRWEKVLGRSSSDVLKLEKEIRMMEKKFEHRSREGKSTASLHRAITHKKRRLRQLRLRTGLGEEQQVA